MAEAFPDQGSGRDASALPYRLRATLLTPFEISLYRALKEVANDRYVIFAKVALNEVFSIVRPNENVHYFGKLFRKYVDFLLCDPDSLKPQIGVEVVRPAPDGNVREADRFMQDLFLSAGLPLVQLRADDILDSANLMTQIQQASARARRAGSRAANTSQDSVPMCPVCGKMTVLRIQRAGRAEQKLYYGCVDNPGCPGQVALR